MAQTSWPFENIDTTEVQFSQWARHINEGIRPDFANELEVFADDSGLNVKVKSGQAMVRGHYYASTAEETLTITTPDATNPRIDSVVLELDIVANSILLKVVAGTPDASPVAPTLTQSEDGNVYQLLLANVDVAAGVFSIEASDVTDLRNLMSSPVNDIITTEGDLIVGDGNGKASRLPIGTADQVLTSDGTTVSFQDAAIGAEVYETGTHTVSKPAGLYLAEFTDSATINGNALSKGINDLSSFTSISVPFGFTTTDDSGGLDINGVAFGNGLFVYGADDGIIETSPDGITWTPRTSNFGTSNINAVGFGDGLFVAGGTFSNTLITSPDGITWTTRTSGTSSQVIEVNFTNGDYFAMGDNGMLITSPNGITWTSIDASFGSTQTDGLAFGNGIYVFVGRSNLGHNISTSTDLTNWTTRSVLSNTDLLNVQFADNLFVATGDGGLIGTSTDGINWTSHTNPLTTNIKGLTYSDDLGLWFAVGQTGEVATSTDAITWTLLTTETSFNFNDITSGNGLVVAVGQDKLIGVNLKNYLVLTELPNAIQP